MSKSGREKACIIGSRLRFFRNPRDFPFPLAKGRDAGGDCLARCRPCGRRSWRSAAPPTQFLEPCSGPSHRGQPSRRGSLCADHSPVVLPTRRLPRASGRFRNVSSSPRDCTCSARITVMTRPRRVEQDEGTYIEHLPHLSSAILEKRLGIRKYCSSALLAFCSRLVHQVL